MTWKKTDLDSLQKMAQMVETPGFTLPLSADGQPPSLPPANSRLLQGPFVMDGDLCDVLPGEEAVVLVSPTGERILMQNEGRVTFHVPYGWKIIVGHLPLRQQQKVHKLLKVGDEVEAVETKQSVLQLENIPELYRQVALHCRS